MTTAELKALDEAKAEYERLVHQAATQVGSPLWFIHQQCK